MVTVPPLFLLKSHAPLIHNSLALNFLTLRLSSTQLAFRRLSRVGRDFAEILTFNKEKWNLGPQER